MTDEQIKHMVSRFLGWRLPENFNPDDGISFKRMFNEHTAHPMKHEPQGTNLFDYEQAQGMVRYMIEGLHVTSAAGEVAAERQRQITVEGWAPAHDDLHDKGELLRAAVCYAQRRMDEDRFGVPSPPQSPAAWPWDEEWWKPRDRRRDLIRAAALIVAEIERFDRSAAGQSLTSKSEDGSSHKKDDTSTSPREAGLREALEQIRDQDQSKTPPYNLGRFGAIADQALSSVQRESGEL